MKAVQRLGVVVLALAMAGCTQSATPASKVALSHTFDNPEALAQAVLNRLASKDVAGLRALALSEQEFRDHVWPELDTSRPERNVPFEYAWGQLKQRSDGSLDGIVGRYAGGALTFISTRYTGDTTKYASFSVMRDTEIVAAEADGKQLVLRLFGSAMLKDGRYKVFSYVVD